VDPVRYRQRNVVERAIARLKQHRAIATRYDCEDRRVLSRVVV
jgi:transposase